MSFLFDTDAISELLRQRPLAGYIEWLQEIPRDEQFTTSVVVGELYKGAYRSSAKKRHLDNIEKRILPAVTVLPYDVATRGATENLRPNWKKQDKCSRMLIYKLPPRRSITTWSW